MSIIMLTIADFILVCVFLFFYVSLFYNLPILLAGVRDFRRYNKGSQKKIVMQRKSLPFFSLMIVWA